MSDTPPDRKEEAGAPEGSANPWMRYFVWVVLSLVVYVLSTGPMEWLSQHGYVPVWAFAIYYPLDYLPASITSAIDRYANLWVP